MKVVLFCGGFGMRMRNDATDPVPKPMQLVGPRPLIWHIMRYYAHFGHREFILCLGYGARYIKEYFLDYRETESNDFVLRDGRPDLLATDVRDWTITFVDTGLDTAIGERLRRVRPHLNGDEYFLANYADVLTDAPMNDIIDWAQERSAIASMLLVPPQSSFHCIETDGADDRVTSITPVSEFPVWVNGGYFVLSQRVFEVLPEGGDLVADACMTLAARNELLGYRHGGFWKPADTFKERAELDAAYEHGDHPWVLWDQRVGC